VLGPGERVTTVPCFPPAAGVDHVRAQPDTEEVVGHVVVVPDRARRGAHRGQPPGGDHGSLGTSRDPTPACRWAATSPTVCILPGRAGRPSAARSPPGSPRRL